MTWSDRWRQTVEQRLLPLLATVLPWRWFFRVATQLGRGSRLFGEDAETSHRHAREFLPVAEKNAWLAVYRRMRIVDQVDAFFALRRSDRWLDRHMRIVGEEWPPGPVMVLTFHYGEGLWALRHLRRTGHPASFLSAPIVPEAFPGAPGTYRFERRRMAAVAMAGGAPLIYSGGSSAKMEAVLRAGGTVVGLVDVPPPWTRGSFLPVPFLGRTAWFPYGLFRVADRAGVPIVSFICRLAEDGRRELLIRRLRSQGEDRLREMVAQLEQALVQDSADWHLWPQVELFFSPPEAAAS